MQDVEVGVAYVSVSFIVMSALDQCNWYVETIQKVLTRTKRVVCTLHITKLKPLFGAKYEEILKYEDEQLLD